MLIVDTVVLGVTLCLATVTDMRRRVVPNGLVLAGVVLFLLLHTGKIDLLVHRLTAGAMCSVSALAISATYRLFRGTPGMGMGDVKLLFVVGLYAGVYGLWMFMLACCLGAVVGGVALFLRYVSRDTRLPFAPFLLLGWAVSSLGFVPERFLFGV